MTKGIDKSRQFEKYIMTNKRYISYNYVCGGTVGHKLLDWQRGKLLYIFFLSCHFCKKKKYVLEMFLLLYLLLVENPF